MNRAEKQDEAAVVIADYMNRLDAGESVSRDQVLADHPELADELRDYFDAERQLGLVLAAPVQALEQGSAAATAGPGAGDSVPARSDSFEKLPVKFGRYHVQKILGQGAMGAVYLARDTNLDRDVALKTPKLDSFTDSEVIERFEREAQAAATLHHRNICPVFDFGKIDGVRFLTMAYIDGKPLSHFVSEKQPMPSRKAALIIRKLAHGLQAAHNNGVVHRDLKPANVMVDKASEPVVMDFGLAGRTENVDQSRLTGVGVLMGSPGYMSPEQVSGNPEAVTHATDIYSLGVILFELLTGQLPYRGSVVAIIGQIISDASPDVGDIRNDVDESLASICRRMMAKSVADRFQSMQEVADALTEYLRNPQANRDDANESSVIVPHTANDDSKLQAAISKISAVPQPRATKPRLSKKSQHAKKQLLWTAAGLLSLIVLAVIVIELPDGTKIKIADDGSKHVELKTNTDGSLKSLTVTAEPDTENKTNGADSTGTQPTPDSSTTDSVATASPPQPGEPVTIHVLGGTTIVAVSPDSQFVAGTNDTTPRRVFVWDSKTGTQVSKWTMSDVVEGPARHLSFSQDGKSLLCCMGRRWILLDASTGKEEPQARFPAAPQIVVFPQRPLALALYHESDVHRKKRNEVPQRLRVWNWQSGEILHDENFPFEGSPYNYPAVSSDERYITLGREHNHIRYQLAVEGNDISITNPIDMERTSRVRGRLIFSPNNRFAATSVKGKQGMAIVLDVATGRIVSRIGVQEAQASNDGHQFGASLAFTSDSDRLVMAEHTGRVALWDVESGSLIRELQQFRKSGNHWPPMVRLTSDGRVVVAGGEADPRITIQSL